MSDRVLVPKATRLFKVANPEPLSWQMVEGRPWLTDSAGHFVCLNNGDESGKGWDIASDGAVSPSIHCVESLGGCGWHVFVRLEGWKVTDA